MHPHQDRVALPDDSRHSPVRCCFVCLPCSWAGDALVWALPCLEYKQPLISAISPNPSRTLASALCPSSFSSPKGYFPLGSLQHLHTCPGHTISAGLVPTSWTEFCRSGPIRYLHCCCKPHPRTHKTLLQCWLQLNQICHASPVWIWSLDGLCFGPNPYLCSLCSLSCGWEFKEGCMEKVATSLLSEWDSILAEKDASLWIHQPSWPTEKARMQESGM